MKETKHTQEELKKIQEESEEQKLPEQGKVFTVSEKIRKRVHNLPDPTRPPLGYDEYKAFDRVFPYIRLPRLLPNTLVDTVKFNAPEMEPNQLILGDNLEVLRTIPTESIDLIYIDPPFFSGRNYNVIWGDSNEVRSFHDIWEGGIDSYLVWLNARLWEMRRVLTKTGSIYVHCDWHASHYIKTEMDKIFGYENFKNEIIWCYTSTGALKPRWFKRKHDVIFWYTKSQEEWIYNLDIVRVPYSEKTVANYQKGLRGSGFSGDSYKEGQEKLGKAPEDFWADIAEAFKSTRENIGYPTQKPEALIERIIQASSQEGGIVADFFCGGGTTLAVAQRLKRRFIGCDSSRIAIAVTLDRLVKVGEEMSGVKSNLSKKEMMQLAMVKNEKVPNIEVSYLGVYPIDKFEDLEQEKFISFILTCYDASRNTAEGVTHGFRPPGQSEPILIGPADPKESVDAKVVRDFFDEIKERLEPNKPVKGKIIGWRFSKHVQEYLEILKKYITDNRLFADDNETPLIDLELIPIRSNKFRQRVLARYLNVEDAEFYLRFPDQPIVREIKVKKTGDLEYKFEAVDAFSAEEDGWLVNCQWDFDYQEGHFAADNEYILSREKVKDKKRGERFEAVLIAKHKFEKSVEYTIACKVQDNLAGETILSTKLLIK